ncbi:MAG TPA: hypothetical protein VJQ25_02575, partial [Nitrospira sp.]|nr:hypothetical protein [Nitrospira sp.]
VLRMNDPKNVVKNDGLGPDELNTNPRMLIVAFADKATKKYSSALVNHTLIPRHTNPVMLDPLEDVAIVKGTLQVSLDMFMSAGSWYTSRTKFIFRYQDKCFRLIGYDSKETKRNTGETSAVSINYLTKKMKTTKGTIQSDQEEVSWKGCASRSFSVWTQSVTGWISALRIETQECRTNGVIFPSVRAAFTRILTCSRG